MIRNNAHDHWVPAVPSVDALTFTNCVLMHDVAQARQYRSNLHGVDAEQSDDKLSVHTDTRALHCSNSSVDVLLSYAEFGVLPEYYVIDFVRREYVLKADKHVSVAACNA